jgi:hypothetical protein
VTRNSLIVSGDASKRYYVFQVVERSPNPNRLLAKSRCAIAAQASYGNPFNLFFAFTQWTARADLAPYVSYPKYVMDPMFCLQ